MSITFKDVAAARGETLMQVQHAADADQALDVALDAKIAEEAGKGGCVVATWLAPWKLAHADVRLWVECPEDERAKRVAKRDRMTPEQAREHVQARDAQNVARYQKWYGINILDHSRFDAALNSGTYQPQALARIAKKIVGEKMKLKQKQAKKQAKEKKQ